jgi:uncharacterized repeat protein (TIGR01451 family)
MARVHGRDACAPVRESVPMRTSVPSSLRWFFVLILSTSAWAADLAPTGLSVPGEVLVKIKTEATQEEIASIEQLADAGAGQRIAATSSGTIWKLRSRSRSTSDLTASLRGNANVLYAEPNYIVHLEASPNDPSYENLWGLRNTGQVIGLAGLPGVDIDAEAAWNLTTGSAAVVVGVIDTGVDYTHPDLAANMWSNPGGIGNAACGAGTHGFNSFSSTCDPMDDHYHGTHVAGTIGAAGNNGIGVAGVNWTASIMALKFLDSGGYGDIAGAVTAIEFAVQAKIAGVNVRVLSNSWGGFPFSKSLLDEINRANEHDILFVASAGNNGVNTDFTPHYPSGYATANMISVAATDNRDNTAYFTNYGLATVHLGAPGVDVLSTTPNGAYSYLSGTSMAAPHVAGVAALVLAQTPGLSTAQVKSAILDNVDPIFSLAGKTVTGGRLNAARALGIPPGPDFALAAAPPTQSISPGSTATYTVTITPSAGFAGSVDLSASGLPAGATASFSPNPATTTSTLTVNTLATTPTGTSTPIVTGTSGALVHATGVQLITTSTPPIQNCPTLTLAYGYSATAPASVTVADFNGDGRSDFAVTNPGINRIAIRLGNSNGTFQTTPALYLAGTAPIFSAAGDFNRDGKPDLAVANSGSNNISILLGNGDGTLQSPVQYAAGTSPFAVAVADFNGDGKSDLAAADNGSSQISIFLGNGDGTFQAAVHYATEAGPFALAVADVDRDGSPDLAVANHHTGTISLFLGNGDGTFAAAVDYATADAPSSIVFGDFNRDGNVDMAVANHDSDNISILNGNGNGTFAAAVHHAAGNGPIALAVVDFDGNGHSDLAVTNEAASTISLLISNGAGGFGAPQHYTTDSEPNHLAAGDFDGNGKTDLLVANVAGDSVYVFLNIGTCSRGCSTIVAPVHYALGGAPYSVVSGDFNGDGRGDLAAGARGIHSVAVQLGNGDGTFHSGVTVGVGTNPDAVAAGDFNRDGVLDIASANSGSDNASVLLGNGNGTFVTPVPYALGTTPRSIATADFNRDGALDLVAANAGSGNVSVLLGNGDGTFQSPLNATAGTTPFHAAPGDFNRDGIADLAVANFGSGNVSILLGNGDGSFQTATNFAAGTSPRAVVIADFNRDGKLDLAAINGGSNNVSILIGTGSGSFQAAVHYDAGTSPYTAAAADLNDDGVLDLAVANNGSNNVSVLLGTGSGTFNAAVQTAGGSSPAAIVAADFNRDGKPDLGTACTGTSSLAVLRNSCPVPDLTVTKTHAGTFAQGDTGKTYTITVTNSGEAATSGVVSVQEIIPIGLTPTALSGSGWSCLLPTLTCTRNDALAGGASYPPITMTVNIAGGAAASITNTVNVSGGGELNAANSTASDTATIAPATDLIVVKTHTGSFAQGATGRTYTIVVKNAGGLPTSGMVTVTDTLPAGLSATAISGSGWSCTLGTLTCTRSNVLAGGANYPAITVTVNVAANAPASLTNTATVSGGGDSASGNNTSADPTVVWAANTCGSFGLPEYYGVGSNPRGVAAGHFNGDSHADLAVINYYPGTVSILLGNGDGTMQEAVDYPAGSYPRAIQSADFDNDGDTDLVILTEASISVLLGNGTGGFAAPIQVPDLYSNAMAIGDLNQDGKLDLALINSSTLRILLGSGNGMLQAGATYSISDSTAMVLADFNGDARPDLVVATQYDGAFLFIGNGDATFQEPAVTPANLYSTSSLAAGDFDQDGNRDLAYTRYYYGIDVMLGNGDGTFETPVNYSSAYYSSQILIEDINGDGKLDLLVAGQYSSITSLLGNGDGTFQPFRNTFIGDATQIAVSDFNHDGKPDIALTSTYVNAAGVALGGCADLTISKSHAGNFTAGQADALYTLVVHNGGEGTASGTVTVVDTLPAGLTANTVYGYGWNCTLATLTCTTNASIPPDGDYEEIFVYVNVAGNAAANVVNTATVAGGGDANAANNSASDPTTIVQASDLTITKTHNGTFVQGQNGRTYTITVSNIGSVATSGTVYVADYLPSGLNFSDVSGPGWNCTLFFNPICSRSDALAANSAYPPITVTVNVSNSAPSSATNNAAVSGGGDFNASNNSAGDFTVILGTPQNLVATAANASQVTLSWNFVGYATSYEVYRSWNNGPFTYLGATSTNGYIDGAVLPNKTYLYRVRAREGSAITSFGNIDMATTMMFADDPVEAGVTKMRALHINELRNAVNAVRAAAGLAPWSFTDSPLAAGMAVRPVHFMEMRSALDEARALLGLISLGYGEATIPAGSTIKAAHVRELRAGVK